MLRKRQFGNGVVLGVLISFIAGGCSKSASEEVEKTAPASGIVTFNGEPVKDATIIFHPQGPGNPATGRTEENGRFVLTTYSDRDGAVLGMHVVTVELTPLGGLPGMEVESTGATPIPQRYADPSRSPLTADVKSDVTNNFELVLEE